MGTGGYFDVNPMDSRDGYVVSDNLEGTENFKVFRQISVKNILAPPTLEPQ